MATSTTIRMDNGTFKTTDVNGRTTYSETGVVTNKTTGILYTLPPEDVEKSRINPEYTKNFAKSKKEELSEQAVKAAAIREQIAKEEAKKAANEKIWVGVNVGVGYTSDNGSIDGKVIVGHAKNRHKRVVRSRYWIQN
jgi:hypothetical protein